ASRKAPPVSRILAVSPARPSAVYGPIVNHRGRESVDTAKSGNETGSVRAIGNYRWLCAQPWPRGVRTLPRCADPPAVCGPSPSGAWRHLPSGGGGGESG